MRGLLADRPAPPRRAAAARAWAVRAVFLAVVLGCAAWSLDGRWGEVGDALREVHPGGLVAAVVLTMLGLLATSLVWRLVLAAFGHAVPAREARSVFFVSQLGKYVPGAVWAIGVQARMARRHDVPVRVTVTTALIFTGVHVLTAGLVGSVLVVAGALRAPGPGWLWALGAVGCLVGLVPAVTGAVVRRAAGTPLVARWPDVLGVAALMAGAWTAYALALLLVVPDPSVEVLGALAGAFAIGYTAGVVVVLAPAGLGAREATFVALLSPVTGLPVATAVALLARVVHTVADLLLAALCWVPARAAGGPADGAADGAGAGSAGGAGTADAAPLSVAGGSVRGHDDDRL